MLCCIVILSLNPTPKSVHFLMTRYSQNLHNHFLSKIAVSPSYCQLKSLPEHLILYSSGFGLNALLTIYTELGASSRRFRKMLWRSNTNHILFDKEKIRQHPREKIFFSKTACNRSPRGESAFGRKLSRRLPMLCNLSACRSTIAKLGRLLLLYYQATPLN